MYPLRSITFIAELIHPPVSYTVEDLQQIHHRAFPDDRTRYANFQVGQGGAQMANPSPRPGAVSAALVGADRLRIQEQMTGMSREDFQARVGELARILLEVGKVSTFVAEQFLIQSLINPRSNAPANEFLTGTLFSMESSDLEAFERPVGIVGLRLSFPMTQAEQPLFNVRVEGYERDPRSLFLENVGLFRTPVASANLDDLGDQFEQTYAYIEGQVVPFIARFDGKPRP